MFWLILLLVLNFIISWSNAKCCGRYWSESKVEGGWFRFNVIIGYIMAIAGFTMVYGSILLLLLPYILPLIPAFENVDMTALLQLTSDLLYILIATAVVPTGFFIWFQSLAAFWKKKTLANGLNNGPELHYSKEQIAEAIEKLGTSPSIRGEALTLEQFAQLADILLELEGK